MKNLALLVGLCALLVLSLILLFQKPIHLENKYDIEKVNENDYVWTSGNVENVKNYYQGYLISLDNGIDCILDSPVALGKNIKVVGVIEKYRINHIRATKFEYIP